MKVNFKKVVFIALVGLATNVMAQNFYNYTPQSMTSEVQTCQRELKGDVYEKGISSVKDISKKTKFYCKSLQKDQIENLLSLYKQEVSELSKSNPEEYNNIKKGVVRERKCMDAFDKSDVKDDFNNLDQETQNTCKDYKQDFVMKQMLRKLKI